MTIKAEKTFTHKGETFTVRSERTIDGVRIRVFDSKGKPANRLSYSVNIDTMMDMAGDGYEPVRELVELAENDVKRLS